MAKPQAEDRFTQIPNEELEKLAKLHLRPNQWQVLLVIIRKTYGFHKKVDYIANKQIEEATILGKTVVSRCLKGLSDIQIITRKGKYIGIQKDCKKWGKLAIQPTLALKLAEQPTSLDNKSKQNSHQRLAISSSRLAIQSTKVSSPEDTQNKKETLTKDTLQKKGVSKKKRYGEFKNVLLTDVEYQKLVKQFGEAGTKDRIEALSEYKKSRGKKYQDDYATVLAWERREERKKGDRSEQRSGTHRRGDKESTAEELRQSLE